MASFDRIEDPGINQFMDSWARKDCLQRKHALRTPDSHDGEILTSCRWSECNLWGMLPEGRSKSGCGVGKLKEEDVAREQGPIVED